jgi:hypothetical protein
MLILEVISSCEKPRMLLIFNGLFRWRMRDARLASGVLQAADGHLTNGIMILPVVEGS